MNEAMLAQRRELGAAVDLTLPTGAVRALGGSDVLSFAVEEGADSPLLPGGVLSARLTLELANEEGQWRGQPLVGATAEVYVLCGGERLACGAYIIDSVSAAERSGAVKLSGSDSIASELTATFVDGLDYPATLQQVWEHWVGQTRYVWSGEIPNGAAVIVERPDWGEVTLRRAAGWIAQAAGGFVRVTREGALEMAACTGGEAVGLDPEVYWSLDDGFHTWGPVAKVRVKNGEESFTVGDGAGETVSVEGNPLFQTEAVAEGMLAQMQGLSLAKAGFCWRGEPSVSVGSRVALTDTYGKEILCTVTRQTMKFDRGFTAECVCGVPEAGDGGIVRAITPEGGLNAGALTGTVDGGLLAADSVTARSIAAKTITAEKLAAGSVLTDHLSAGAVTADKLDADTVSAQTARFVAAEMKKLTANEVGTDELYAALAHVVSLAAGSISAGKVDADRLAAALVEVVSLHAATGDFDFATIRNLVSQAMSLEQGAMDTVYIKNLAVTSANLLSATLGKLVLKGDDGKYYRVFVGSDGTVSTEQVEDVDAEVEGGKQIVETSMNVGSLNATNLQASSAVINQILTTALTAGSITAADALIASATIPALYATSIKAIGDSLDLSANESIRLLVGEKNTVYRQEEQPEEAAVNDLWIQPSTGYTWQCTAAEPLPELYLDGDGNLFYAYADGAEGYEYVIDDDGNLLYSGEGGQTVSADGELVNVLWVRVKDGDLSAAELKLTNEGIMGVVTGTQAWQDVQSAAEVTESQIAVLESQFTQRMDGFELSISETVGRDELRTYVRYEDGAVELGSSASRYTAQISDKGFVVLQDGEAMTSMVQNTVSAPVIEARRQFQLGGFALRIGADGHLLLV